MAAFTRKTAVQYAHPRAQTAAAALDSSGHDHVLVTFPDVLSEFSRTPLKVVAYRTSRPGVPGLSPAEAFEVAAREDADLIVDPYDAQSATGFVGYIEDLRS